MSRWFALALGGCTFAAIPAPALALSPEVAAFREACAGAEQPPSAAYLEALGWRTVEPDSRAELAQVFAALAASADTQQLQHFAYSRAIGTQPASLIVSRDAENSSSAAPQFCRLYLFEAATPLPRNAFDGWPGAKRLRSRVQIGEALYPIESGSGVRYRFTTGEEAQREGLPPGIALSWRTVR